MTDVNMKIERLYKLLEELARADRYDEASTVRWAIFFIENTLDIECK